MSDVLQQLVNGLTLGSLYALIAVGYTVVYGIVQLINFAHGEIFMIGAFGALATWTVLFQGDAGPLGAADHDARRDHRLGRRRRAHGAVRLPAAAQRATAGTAHHRHRRLGLPPGGRPAVLPGRQEPSCRSRPSRWSRAGAADRRADHPASRDLHRRRRWSSAPPCLWYFVNRTRLGRGMQAVSQDPDTARLMGINVDRIIVVAFVLGAVLAAVAGVAQGLQNQQHRLPDRLPRRPQGVHRRRARRHRQHPGRRRSAAWSSASSRPSPRSSSPASSAVGVEGRVGLRAPHRRPRLPAARPARRKGGGPGMSDRLDTPCAEPVRRRLGPVRRRSRLAGAVARSAVGTVPVAGATSPRSSSDLSVYVYPGGLQLLRAVPRPWSRSRSCSCTAVRCTGSATGSRPALAVRALGLGSAVFMTIVAAAHRGPESAASSTSTPAAGSPGSAACCSPSAAWLLRGARDQGPDQAEAAGLGRDPRHRRPARRWPCSWSAFALGQEDGSVFLLFFVARRHRRLGAGVLRVLHLDRRSSPPGTAGCSCSAAFVVAFLFPFTQGGSDANMSIATQVISSRPRRWA